MHATIRRYDGRTRIAPSARRQGQRVLVPKLRKLDGFMGYYLIESGNGVISSVGLFETAEQTDASAKLAASWIRDEKLETAFPNRPRSRAATL